MFVFHLDEDIFNIVKFGTKNVEVRLYDEKRRNMEVGDQVVFFKRPDNKEKIITKIINLKTYSNFNELVQNYDMERLYLKEYTKDDFIKLLERFYNKEEQDKYGVVAIEFEVI